MPSMRVHDIKLFHILYQRKRLICVTQFYKHFKSQAFSPTMPQREKGVDIKTLLTKLEIDEFGQ